jgi:hypothetical protein
LSLPKRGYVRSGDRDRQRNSSVTSAPDWALSLYHVGSALDGRRIAICAVDVCWDSQRFSAINCHDRDRGFLRKCERHAMPTDIRRCSHRRGSDAFRAFLETSKLSCRRAQPDPQWRFTARPLRRAGSQMGKSVDQHGVRGDHERKAKAPLTLPPMALSSVSKIDDKRIGLCDRSAASAGVIPTRIVISPSRRNFNRVRLFRIRERF